MHGGRVRSFDGTAGAILTVAFNDYNTEAAVLARYGAAQVIKDNRSNFNLIFRPRCRVRVLLGKTKASGRATSQGTLLLPRLYWLMADGASGKYPRLPSFRAIVSLSLPAPKLLDEPGGESRTVEGES